MESVDNGILQRMHTLGRGSVVTATTFLDIGSRPVVGKALSRLVQQGRLRRLARDLYDYPKSRRGLGAVAPDPEVVVKAVASKYGARVQRTGAYAANVLGLSTQVPVKVVFLTDGPSRLIRLGKLEIYLRHTRSENVIATAGRMSGLVIQALLHLGRNYVDDNVISVLQRTLSQYDKRELLADIAYAPTWVGVYLRKIATG